MIKYEIHGPYGDLSRGVWTWICSEAPSVGDIVTEGERRLRVTERRWDRSESIMLTIVLKDEAVL